MKKWIGIAALGLLAAWFFLSPSRPSSVPEEYGGYYLLITDLRQIGQAIDIFFSDHEERENVFLAELPSLNLSIIDPNDIVQPISRKENVNPYYSNVIHKKFGTITDIQREVADFRLRE